MQEYISDWDTYEHAIKNDNFGHVVDVHLNKKNSMEIDSIHQKECLRLFKYKDDVEYKPFNENIDNQYAVISLFMDTTTIIDIMNCIGRDGNEILNHYADEYEALRASPFFYKYVKSILAYIVITTIERPTFNFRMYLDYYTIAFLNRFKLDEKILNIMFSKPFEYFINEVDNYPNISTTKDKISSVFTYVKNYILQSGEAQNMQVGNALALAFNFTFACDLMPLHARAPINWKRRNMFELFLYNFNLYPRYVEDISVQPLRGLRRVELAVHTDGGYIGSVVRTFIMRQGNFEFNGIQVKTPQLIMIRDAHRCPSSKHDVHILNNKTRYDWVHSIYYWVPWHSYNYPKCPQETNYDLDLRGPICYYINARKKDSSDEYLMPNEDWNNTFGRCFTFVDNNKLKKVPHFKERIAFGYGNDRAHNHVYSKCKLGLNYGIDEYLALFFIYNEDGSKKIATNTDCTWVHIYYSWDVFPINVFPILNYYDLTKEQRAFLLAAYIVFKGKPNNDQVSILEIYNEIKKIENENLKFILEFIPDSKNIHATIGYSHEYRTDLIQNTINPLILIKNGITKNVDEYLSTPPGNIFRSSALKKKIMDFIFGDETNKLFKLKPNEITEISPQRQSGGLISKLNIGPFVRPLDNYNITENIKTLSWVMFDACFSDIELSASSICQDKKQCQIFIKKLEELLKQYFSSYIITNTNYSNAMKMLLKIPLIHAMDRETSKYYKLCADYICKSKHYAAFILNKVGGVYTHDNIITAILNSLKKTSITEIKNSTNVSLFSAPVWAAAGGKRKLKNKKTIS